MVAVLEDIWHLGAGLALLSRRLTNGLFPTPGKGFVDQAEEVLSASHADLRVDVLGVGAHGVLGYEHLLGDVGVSVAAGEVPQDFLLSFGQTAAAGYRVGGPRDRGLDGLMHDALAL